MKIKGTKKADVLSGDFDRDIISGRKGGDELSGGGGVDLLLGGRGNDILFGGEGDDTLVGGRGHDTFVFNSVITHSDVLYGVDAIMDFDPDKDLIVINAIDVPGNFASYDNNDGLVNFDLSGSTEPYTVATLSVGLDRVDIYVL